MARQWGDDVEDGAVLDVSSYGRGSAAGAAAGPWSHHKWSAVAGWVVAAGLAAALVASWAAPPRRVGVPVVVTPEPSRVTVRATQTMVVPGQSQQRPEPRPSVVPCCAVQATRRPPRPRPEPSASQEPSPRPVPSPSPQESAGPTPAPEPSAGPPTPDLVEETAADE